MQRPPTRRNAASGLFARFLAEAEAELQLLRRLYHQLPIGMRAEAEGASLDARDLLHEKIAEQQRLLEKMRAYVDEPGI